MDSSGVDVEFHLGITNPNRFDLALLGYSYDLRVMTMPLSSGETKGAVVFPARTESDMRLPVHLNFNELLEIFKHQPNLDNLPYRMNARLRLQHPLGELVIPIEKAGTLNIPERYRPGATLDRLRDVLRNIR
ncbi:MAG: LEA type 2 family protein [Geobacteraceae bacterium]|nr:LEA type 2 family protein [Geobacteraceae bacterium]